MKRAIKFTLELLFLFSLLLFVFVGCVEACSHRDADDDSVCDKCGEDFTDDNDVQTNHTHSYSVKNTDSSFIASSADCENAAKYYFSCSCGEKSTETFISGEALGHTEVTDEEVLPSCTESGLTEGKHCSVCNKILAGWEEISSLGHSFSNGVCTRCKKSEYCEELIFVPNGDGTCYVSGMRACPDKDISIPPKSPDGYDVTAIASYAFSSRSNITSVKIPDSVTQIGNNAFSYCYNLTSVTIGSNVSSIDNFAFAHCYKLVEIINKSSVNITVGSGIGLYALEVHDGESKIVNKADYLFLNSNNVNYLVGYIGNDSSITLPETYNEEKYEINSCAFAYLSGVTNVTIPDTVTKIGNWTFYCSKDIVSVTIGNGATSIGELMFYGSGIRSVVIGNSVTSIGESAFKNCSELNSVTFGNSVTSIDNCAFSGCNRLTSITIPNSVTSIGENTFENCTRLTSITIGNGVTSIGKSAFSGCTELTGITIGNSVSSIGENAFYKCNKLASITVDENNTSYKSIDGNLYTKDEKTLWQYAVGKTEKSFAIPNSVAIIGRDAFCDSTLESVTVPDSVTEIGDYAFYNCKNLTAVSIPNSVTSIGKGAFSDCIGFTDVIIPDSVESIGDSAFFECSSLASVTIGNSVTHIGDYAFYFCNNLANVTMGSSIAYIGDYAFYSCGELTDIVIPDSAIQIGAYAFYECKGITSLALPNNVTQVGEYAFYNCTAINSITLGNSVTKIGDYAFYYCQGITELIIPSSLVSIGEEAFSYCVNLTSVTVGNNLTTIGNAAFSGCYRLIEIINKSSLDIIAGATKYGGISIYALEIHSGESKIVNEDGYLFYTVDGKNYLFGYTGDDTELILPESYNGEKYDIHNCAFIHRTDIISVFIPNTVTSIGAQAFYCCSGLTSIEFENTSGWFASLNPDAASGTEVDLTDPQKNVNIIIYDGRYWKRIDLQA